MHQIQPEMMWPCWAVLLKPLPATSHVPQGLSSQVISRSFSIQVIFLPSSKLEGHSLGWRGLPGLSANPYLSVQILGPTTSTAELDYYADSIPRTGGISNNGAHLFFS